MRSWFFWKSWPKEYRIIWYSCALLFVVALGFLWYGYFNGIESVIQWQKLESNKTIDVTVHSFRLGPFQLNVPGESYVNLEYYNGGNLVPNRPAAYLHITILALCFVVILSVITTAEKFWYFAGLTLVILFLVTLRFEVLVMLGIKGKWIVAPVLAAYVIPAFIFGRLRPATPFVIRMLVFLGITIALGLCVQFLSFVDYPFYHIYLTSFTSTLILAVLFMILVAHEIVAGFVYVVSSGKEKNLKHLILITTIYLINVVLTGLQEIGSININFIFINVYLLLTISAVLGIWGFRKREGLYERILSFYPFGGFVFLALGAICFSTIAHLMCNGNDPGVTIMREAILFAHAGYGLMFLLYLLSNFGQAIMDELNVWRVMYNPKRMPFYTFSLAGFVTTLAFVFYANWTEFVFRGFAAFYNTAGDLHALLDNGAFAEAFYLQANRHSYTNHRSDYMLAKFKASVNNLEDAHYYYNATNNGRYASEYSLNNDANIYFWENELFKAVKGYQRGLDVFPNSGELANNAGIMLAQLHKIDSATLYLNKAREDNQVKNTAEANFFAMAALEKIPIKIDSTISIFNTKDKLSLANAIALASITKSKFETPLDPLAQSELDVFSATLLNNYILYHAKDLDTAFINQAYRILSDSVNSNYSEPLKSALAFGFYHTGNVSKAMEILAEQVFLSNSYQGRYNYIMGLWALEQNNPRKAQEFFNYAMGFNYKDARFYYAIALTESGQSSKALTAWDSVAAKGNEEQKEIAARIKTILQLPPAQAISLNDADKYQFCRYRLTPSDSVLFDKLSNTFESSNYKAQALLDFSRKCLEKDLVVPAIQEYRRIAGLKLTNKDLYEESRHYELQILASRREVINLAKQINKGITFPPSRNLEKLLYTALIQEANGDTTNATKSYRILGKFNPYYEEAVLAAYQYFAKQKPNTFYAYSILADAIQTNTNSIRLFKAFQQEAQKRGFDEYAASAAERIRELESQEP